MKFLKWRNKMEKTEAIARLEKLPDDENNILIAVLPKRLYCDICHKQHPYDDVSYIPAYNLNACVSCEALIGRLERNIEQEA